MIDQLQGYYQPRCGCRQLCVPLIRNGEDGRSLGSVEGHEYKLYNLSCWITDFSRAGRLLVYLEVTTFWATCYAHQPCQTHTENMQTSHIHRAKSNPQIRRCEVYVLTTKHLCSLYQSWTVKFMSESGTQKYLSKWLKTRVLSEF